MENTRLLEKNLIKHFERYNQAIILLGARQVGKTTLLRKLFPNATYLLVDESAIYRILESYSSDAYKNLIGDSKLIFIDELHLLTNPGQAVKLIHDQLQDVRIIVTGSSSLHIKNKTSESMAGRSIDYRLYPLTIGEYLFQKNIELTPGIFLTDKILNLNTSKTIKKYDLTSILENLLLYGQYPYLVNTPSDKKYLNNLVEKAIFKDIIELNLIDNRSKALELLKLLAYQIGNLISYTELANKLGISAPTIQRYIEIFEQSFLIYRIYPFSTNGRDEIGKAPKIYFWDLGLRNALINNFENTAIRNDLGALFENFVINEVKKEIDYLELDFKVNYWRLKSGSEIDLVLSNSTIIYGCEIKYSKGKISKAFQNRYPNAKVHLVTGDNII